MTPQSLRDPRAEKAAGKRKKSARRKAGATSPITQLPFVCDTPEGEKRRRNFWCATPLADYSANPKNYTADCETGQSHGLAALRYMRDNDCSPLLGWIVSSMIRQECGNGSPDSDGVVIGFCSTIATAAAAGSSETYLRRLEQYYRDCAERLAGATS